MKLIDPLTSIVGILKCPLCFDDIEIVRSMNLQSLKHPPEAFQCIRDNDLALVDTPTLSIQRGFQPRPGACRRLSIEKS